MNKSIISNEKEHQMNEQAHDCIEAHAKQAVAVSFVPFVSLPMVYGVCAKMIVNLDKIFGIPTAKGWDSEIVQDIIAGIIVAPALMIPILGAGVASEFVKSIGKNYAKAVTAVVSMSTHAELCDNKLVAEKVKSELNKIYKEESQERSNDKGST